MLDLSTLSKSYPYLSLSRQLGLSYSDVLLVSDWAQPDCRNLTSGMRDALARVGIRNKHAIYQVTAAVATGEIGHG